MNLKEILWPQDRIEHVARHGVSAEEFEEVCQSRSRVIFRAKSEGASPAYYVFGQTKAGRYLFCVILQFADEKVYPVTARPMTDREKQRFKKWKKR